MAIVVSDLHLGDGGPRDNFVGKDAAFMDMLRYYQDDKIIIDGDLFELWQSNISAVLMKRLPLLDYLAEREAIYVLGNHDLDLYGFIGTSFLNHSFFDTMCMTHWVDDILIVHGHEEDPDCNDFDPGLARISAIYTGMGEDKGRSEGSILARLKRLRFWHIEPDIVAEVEARRVKEKAGRIIFGHTHSPGRRGNVYNSGSWADGTDYLRIQDGIIRQYYWGNGPVQVNYGTI